MMEQLESQGRAADDLFSRPVVVDPRGPTPPGVARRIQRLFRRHRLMPADGAAPAQSKAQTRALLEFGYGAERLQRDGGRKLKIEMGAGQAVDREATASRPDLSLPARFDLDLQAHVSLRRFDHTNQFAASGCRVLRKVRGMP